MKINKKSALSGFKDLGPKELVQRNHILSLLTKLFRKQGFVELQTAAVERFTKEVSNYGEEGQKLIYQVINSQQQKKEADKALRYDLTLPLARYVAMHQQELVFPFRRYQIQPVWRAERPQKGRYREFTQCDIDIVGADSLQYEAELLDLVLQASALLKIDSFICQLNHRKLIEAIATKIGFQEKPAVLARELDKLDKIGWHNVEKNLSCYLKQQKNMNLLYELASMKGSLPVALKKIEKSLGDTEMGAFACKELLKLESYCKALNINLEHLVLSPMLARGMHYYTGVIFELHSPAHPAIGSFIGGGRYDKLTAQFGLAHVSGVGLSFGIDRLEILLKETKKNLPEQIAVHFLLLPIDLKSHLVALQLAVLLRKQVEQVVEVLPPPKKLFKGLQYANRKKIPLVGVLGENETNSQKIALKEMQTGEQKMVAFQQLHHAITAYFAKNSGSKS